MNDHNFLRSAIIKSSLYWANHAKLLAKAVLEEKQHKLIHKQNQIEARLHSINYAYGSQSSSESEFEDDDKTVNDDPEIFGRAVWYKHLAHFSPYHQLLHQMQIIEYNPHF